MHYVKQFNINGVDTKQVACIELQGKPNAATEGQVGVLGVDITSPTHDVYKCVAVKGSIYTWELLSSGMSIMNAKTTGEGADISFTYDTLLKPNNYVVKVGDLILDRGGYLYQVRAVNNLGCDATYTGAHFGVEGEFGVGHSLVIKEGQLQLVSEYGNVLSKVDYLPIDSSTLYRDATTGTVSVAGVRTIDGSLLKFFVGTQAEYDALSEAEQKNLFAIITNDGTRDNLTRTLEIIFGKLDGIERWQGNINKTTELETVAIDTSNPPSQGLKDFELTVGKTYIFNCIVNETLLEDSEKAAGTTMTLFNADTGESVYSSIGNLIGSSAFAYGKHEICLKYEATNKKLSILHRENGTANWSAMDRKTTIYYREI